jgi:hypothetical protein
LTVWQGNFQKKKKITIGQAALGFLPLFSFFFSAVKEEGKNGGENITNLLYKVLSNV